MKTAWMFPGQGSQFPGMAKELFENFSCGPEILGEAESLAGFPLDSIRISGPTEALKRPDIAEPLIASVSIAYAQTLADAGFRADFVAGYSAGEVAALFAAGALTRTDALKVAVIRGRVLNHYRDPNVRMVAVSRVPTEIVETCISGFRCETEIVEVAGWNAPDHATIVGTDVAVRWAETVLVGKGAESSEIPVDGMWHSSTLRSAAAELRAELASIPFTAPKIPISTSVCGFTRHSPEELRNDLADQIAAPVRWRPILTHWQSVGVTNVIEVGAGRTLLGLLRRNWTDATAYSVTSVEGRSGNIRPLKRILASLTS